MPTVLLIDDNAAVRTALEVLLSLQGLEVLEAGAPEAALELLERAEVDLVIQDMNFHRQATSGAEGVELFHRIRQRQPELPIILLTAWTHLETAVDLVKAGAADYLAKPWDDARLLTTVRNLLQLRSALLEKHALVRGRREARQALRDKFDLRDIVYDSDTMHELLVTATQVAPADVPVLITGPNGAGKEVLADIIHANSACADGPLVKVNVGALPGELMESELFGAEAGAYTGAAKGRQGRFEAADGGTLFLDEIGNLSLAGQAKLLRVLQTGEFERLGSSVTRRVRVRILSATNADLRVAIREGRFREDLFYRLNVIELKVAALAARPDDILPLARHFLDAGFTLDDSAQKALRAYAWPGNTRELKNTIRRACLLATDRVIRATTLGLPAVEADTRIADREPERQDIEAALQRSSGVVAHAARQLGLSRQALYRRMEKLGIRDKGD